MIKYQEQRIATEGIMLQVREYPRKADAVLFLHFGGANLMMWQRVVPFFQERFHLILVDLRDHGKSDKPQVDDHIDQMARDLIGVLKFFNLDQVHVIGSSMGAEVGLSLAASYPDRVKSLVCEGALYSEYGPYSSWQGSEQEFREHVEKQLSTIHNRQIEVFPSIQALVQSRKKIFLEDGMWNPYLEAYVEYDAHPSGNGKFTRSFQRQASENYMSHYFNCRFEDYYRRVQCPVLMVTGDETPENELETKAIQAMSKIPVSGRLVVVPGWEHPYGWMVQPDMMVRIVLEFLSEVSG
jgi:pimeloyl-ACP methyl ester carboxylesterase